MVCNDVPEVLEQVSSVYQLGEDGMKSSNVRLVQSHPLVELPCLPWRQVFYWVEENAPESGLVLRSDEAPHL